MLARLSRFIALASFGLAACSEEAQRPDGPQVAVSVAPLLLPQVQDVCYTLSVFNGPPAAPGTDTVWTETGVCSSTFGNSGGGDISYVGPCDASPNGRVNYVRLVLDTIEVPPGQGSLPTSGSPQKFLLDDQITSTDGDPDFVNPCTTTECTLSFPCMENEDTAVVFDIVVMRDAEQGFFDIAVNFEDIFCSAKLDTCYADPDGEGPADEEPIKLLFGKDDDGELVRGHTAVLALACTGGANDEDTTHLYMSDIVVQCGADVTWLDPSLGPGNVLTPPGYLDSGEVWQYAIYEGQEQLLCNGQPCDKDYWNVAFGIAGLPAGCTVTATATAADHELAGGYTPLGTKYPIIEFGPLTLTDQSGVICSQNGLDGGVVHTSYTPFDEPEPFRYVETQIDDEEVSTDPIPGLHGLVCEAFRTGDWNDPTIWKNCASGIPTPDSTAIIDPGGDVALVYNVVVANLIVQGTVGGIYDVRVIDRITMTSGSSVDAVDVTAHDVSITCIAEDGEDGGDAAGGDAVGGDGGASPDTGGADSTGEDSQGVDGADGASAGAINLIADGNMVVFNMLAALTRGGDGGGGGDAVGGNATGGDGGSGDGADGGDATGGNATGGAGGGGGNGCSITIDVGGDLTVVGNVALSSSGGDGGEGGSAQGGVGYYGHGLGGTTVVAGYGGDGDAGDADGGNGGDGGNSGIFSINVGGHLAANNFNVGLTGADGAGSGDASGGDGANGGEGGDAEAGAGGAGGDSRGLAYGAGSLALLGSLNVSSGGGSGGGSGSAIGGLGDGAGGTASGNDAGAAGNGGEAEFSNSGAVTAMNINFLSGAGDGGPAGLAQGGDGTIVALGGDSGESSGIGGTGGDGLAGGGGHGGNGEEIQLSGTSLTLSGSVNAQSSGANGGGGGEATGGAAEGGFGGTASANVGADGGIGGGITLAFEDGITALGVNLSGSGGAAAGGGMATAGEATSGGTAGIAAGGPGGHGGHGGGFAITGGDLTLTNNLALNLSGGDAGAGANAFGSSSEDGIGGEAQGGSGGDGGESGMARIDVADFSVDDVIMSLSGGEGGPGGAGTSGASGGGVAEGGGGGAGGQGGAGVEPHGIWVTANDVNASDILANASAGTGADGGNAEIDGAAGGDGGDGGASDVLFAATGATSVASANVSVTGGDGGNGADADGNGSAAGNGGDGGDASCMLDLSSDVPVTNVSANGGISGNGGNGDNGGAGGNSGSGGDASVVIDTSL